MSEHNNHLNRREVIKLAAAGSLLAPTGGPSMLRGMAASNPVVEENRRPGSTGWQLTNVLTKDHRSRAIEGFCSRTSVRPGEPVEFFVSTEESTRSVMEIYRMGYYGGKGGSFKKRLGPFATAAQPEPIVTEHRLRECQWAPSAQLTIPDDWVSGVYLGKLSCEAHRYESYVVFIIRDDRAADLLFQCSDTTWQAYNKWPDNYSLHDSDPPNQPHSTRTWVSFDRPYGKYPQLVDQPLSLGSGEFLLWEFPLAFWLEQHGFGVTYWSNIDPHIDPQGLQRVKCFLSVGDDEYWTLDMYHNVSRARDAGLNIGFLSANSVKWMIALEPRSGGLPAAVNRRTGLTPTGQRVELSPSPTARPHRIFYRRGRYGGLMEQEKAAWGGYYAGPFEMEGPNEGLLIGARNTYPATGVGDWIIRKADRWIFEGVGVRNGDAIPGIVGWKFHGDPADMPGLDVIAAGPTLNAGGEAGAFAATVYPGPKENWIFNAATIFWNIGLSCPPGVMIPYTHNTRPHGPDERVRRITTTFLARSGARPHVS